MARHGITTASPPIILAIENSSMCCSIALMSPGLCLAEFSLTSPETHSKRLLDAIAALIREARLDWPLIDAVAISLGPGSFTGVRIGLATAKGLAMAAQTKLIGVNSLDGLANQVIANRQLICPIIDARKKEVYAAFYKTNAVGVAERISEAMVVPPAIIAERLKEPVLFVGDGVLLYQEYLREAMGKLALFAPTELIQPRAASIGAIALRKWSINEFLDPSTAAPEYVRASDAEISSCKFTTPSAG